MASRRNLKEVTDRFMPRSKRYPAERLDAPSMLALISPHRTAL